MLRPIEKFSLEKHTEAYETWGTRSVLFADGLAAGLSVPGFEIEGQYGCGEGYLLITSYDCPFEEAQNFLLLDSRYRVVCRKFLGVTYGSYLLMENYMIDESRIALQFAGEKSPWMLQVHPRRWPAFRKLRLRRPSMAQPRDAVDRAGG